MSNQPPAGPPEGWEPPPQPQGQGWGPPPPPGQGRHKAPLWRRPWFIIVGVVVLVLIFAGLLGDPPQDTQTAATGAPTTVVVTTAAPSTTAEPATTAEPTTTRAPTTTKPASFKMPNVSNRILYEAVTELEDAGVNVDTIEYRWRLADNGPPINPTNWAVSSQNPKAGTRVTAKTKVTLNVIRTDEGF